MKDYRLEVWVTAVCFALAFILGGIWSAFVVFGIDVFFVETAELPANLPEEMEKALDVFYKSKESLYVGGFPLHYFLLIFFSWIGVTVIGIIWTMVMDRLEQRQKS